MSIKIKMRANHKAMIKFDKPEDEHYFIWFALQHRDDGLPHPKISIKNNQGGEIPTIQKKPQVMPPQKLDPKIIQPLIIPKMEAYSGQCNVQEVKI